MHASGTVEVDVIELEARGAVLVDGVGGVGGVGGRQDGECLDGLERVVVAPCLGVFAPYPPETVTTEGEIVFAGQAVGVLHASGDQVEVRSPFSGFMMGLMAHDGERVREGQPVAWLRVFER
jgi:biotin carboxyl carrier protein